MSNLVNYFSISSKRRVRKRDAEARIALGEVVSTQEGEKTYLVEETPAPAPSSPIAAPAAPAAAPNPKAPPKNLKDQQEQKKDQSGTNPKAPPKNLKDQQEQKKAQSGKIQIGSKNRCAGYWMFPYASTFIKLQINETYNIFGTDYKFRLDLASMALLPNYKKLAKVYPPIKNLLKKEDVEKLKHPATQIQVLADLTKRLLSLGMSYCFISSDTLNICGTSFPLWLDDYFADLIGLRKSILPLSVGFDAGRLNSLKHVRVLMGSTLTIPFDVKLIQKLGSTQVDSFRDLSAVYQQYVKDTKPASTVSSQKGRPPVKGVFDDILNTGSGSWAYNTNESHLNETTFRDLINSTQRNGGYAAGGLRKIGNTWITDPAVANRIQNSSFVVTKPPSPQKTPEGNTILKYNFKSQPDRSTTGMRQKGWIEFLPSGRGNTGWSANVKCLCTCPDYKFRWHYVLAKNGAANTPTGQGGEAINAPPNITNPSHAISCCKHLAAMAVYIKSSFSDLDNFWGAQGKQSPAPTKPAPSKPAAKKSALPSNVKVGAGDTRPTTAEWNSYRTIGDSEERRGNCLID